MTVWARPLLLTMAILAAFWFIFSRLHIIVLVRGNFTQLLILFLMLAVVIFLGFGSSHQRW
jgi:hypothetical protein